MQKGFASTLFLVLILLIASSLAGYWFLIRETNPPAPTKVISPAITPKVEDRPQTSLYKNPDLGVEFTLPEGLIVKTETETEYFKRANGNIRNNFTYYVQYSPAEFASSLYVINQDEKDLDKAVFSLLVFQNPENLTPQAFYNRYWYYPFIWGEFATGEKNKISPKNIKLISGVEAGSATIDFRPGNPEFIYLPVGKKDQMIQIHFPSQNPQANEILGSFQITD